MCGDCQTEMGNRRLLTTNHLIFTNWTFSLFRLKLLQFAILLPDIRTNTRTISVTEIVIKAAATKKSLFRVKNLAFKECFNLCVQRHFVQTCTLFSQHEKLYPISSDAKTHLALLLPPFTSVLDELRLFSRVILITLTVKMPSLFKWWSLGTKINTNNRVLVCLCIGISPWRWQLRN